MPEPICRLPTHRVSNQPPPLEHYNAFVTDGTLRRSVGEDLPEDARLCLSDMGEAVGNPHWIEQGFAANAHPPELRAFDRFGQRVDEVRFHPAYHACMELGMRHGTHSVAWTAASHGHRVHSALQYLLTQIEPGVCCPLAMTYASVPVLRQFGEVSEPFGSRVCATVYDPRLCNPAVKAAVTIGMAMTEKQGGSDVRSNTTTAVAESAGTVHYRLNGHKWFCSAPMSDAFLTLAMADGGLSCFLVPRVLPDGTRNRFFIQRLKNKLGNRSNASAEVEYQDTAALRLGEEGAGIRTIMDMVHHTRLDAAVVPAGMMRHALVQAVHHTSNRQAFGARLADQPLMRNVLADLALESMAATLLAMRCAEAFDHAGHDPVEAAFARVAVLLAKFWINKQAPQFIYESLECHGGAGFIEESILPRLYREAPLNSIWEGSGNVICLDLLRVAHKQPHALQTVLEAIAQVCASEQAVIRRLNTVRQELGTLPDTPAVARRSMHSLAVLLQAMLLFERGEEELAKLFVDSRLNADGARCYGCLDGSAPFDRLLETARVM